MITIETTNPLPNGFFEIEGVAYRVIESCLEGGVFKSKLEAADILEMQRVGEARAANAMRDMLAYQWVD